MAADYFDACAAALVSGAQEEFVAELTLRLARMLEAGVSNPDRLGQLSRLAREEALAVWAEWEARVTEQCRAAFEEAVAEEDGRIVASLAELSPGTAYDTAYGAAVAAEAARGVGEILRRQNVALCQEAADAWYRVTADAVLRRESGEGLREVMERGVSALADAGIEAVDYRSGVRTAVDAALRRHAVTQANQARNDLLWRRCDEWGVDLVFTSAHFGARPEHAAWQGRVFSRSGSSPDYPPLVESTGYGTVTGLCGANCVIEGTLVSGPLATAAYRREYAGEVVRIRTALGHDLTVTPNHPVLTGRGWVPANEVEQGDHVFGRVFRDGMPLGVRPDEQEREPTVEHEFHALGDSFGVGTLLGSPADFHGDGVLNQQVDVVLVDGSLMSDLQPTAPKHAPKPLLLDAARLSDPGFSGGPVDEVVVRASHAANGVVGAPAQLSPLLGAHAGHPRAHGLAWGLGHDADAFEPVRDGRLGDAERLGDGGLVHPAIPEVDHATGVNGLSPAVDLKPKLSELIGDEGLSAGEMSPHLPDGRTFLVETDEVVDIDRGTWSGHVYNLSTLGGWYFANGIVTHNCRHTMTPYVEGYSKLPGTDFSEQERLTGMTSDEYYEATQKQRRYEAAVRRTKREIAVGREMGYDMVDKRVLLGRQQARVRQWCAEKGLRRDYERERAYGIGAQPRALKPSGLTIDKALESDRVSRALRTLSVSKADFKEALVAELSARGVSAKGLADLPSDMANGILGDVVAAFRNARGYRRLAAPDGIEQALAATNPRYGRSPRWSNNCQRCIVAYEMRRRGFDVEALPFPGDTDDLQYHTKMNGWPSLFSGGVVDLEPISGTDAAGQIASIESIMGRYGDGARAVIRVRWDNGGGGHVFIAEQVSGETRLVDPQSGSRDCSGYMADALPGFTRLLRIDDAKLSSLIGKAVRNRRAP